MNDYEIHRLENIKRNEALIERLGIKSRYGHTSSQPTRRRKRGQIDDVKPIRKSARIASTPSRPSYDDNLQLENRAVAPKNGKSRRGQRPRPAAPASSSTTSSNAIATTTLPQKSIEKIRAGWSDWKPSAPLPIRDSVTGRFYFESHPSFTPSKSAEEMLREGCFGGSYFRPLFSRHLGITVSDDWQDTVPASWIEELDVGKTVTSPDYDPAQNKYGVACGQSIEQWEAAGWISYRDDIRGWYQWYCRFFQGRRSSDDERQVRRWKRCVGETGRWRRLLLKKYVSMGVRNVKEAESQGVSPVMHQTCHHWALQITQADLDEYWETGR